MITGLILVSNSTFGGKVLLENLAYDIALSIRQAQVYGISVQRFGTVFNVAYGMHFDTSDPSHYSTFADACTPANGIYDGPSGSCPGGELVGSVVTIERGFRVTKLCTPAGADIASCTSVATLDLLFKRPEPDAKISSAGVSCIAAPFTCPDSARIVVQSPRGDKTSVVIQNNGQITVQK